MEVLLISIVDNRESNSKEIEILGTEEMPEESYLKPMVNILKKNIKGEGGAK